MDIMCESNGLSDFSCNAISWGLYLGYFLLIGSIVAIAGLFLWNAMQDTKLLIRSAAGAGILVVLFGISFGLSDGKLSNAAIAAGVDETSSKLIGGGLTMFYIVFFIAIIGLVYSEINKALK